MKRSFLRLVVTSVVVCWAVGAAALVLYARSRSWTDERARTDGVFLAYELLQAEPASSRAARLRALRPNFSIPLALLSADDVARRVERAVVPGEQIPLRVSAREEWYFLVFEHGGGALAAGPVHPSWPSGAVPIGVFLSIVGLPLIAGFIAIRLQSELTKVERASHALGTGELSARVDNPDGPSNELAASFNAMAEQIEHLIRNRDELVQAVSHELGSPLSRLRFHMELLDGGSGEQTEARLGAMARELDALDELVTELLTYVQSDSHEIEVEAFDPHRALRDLTELAGLEVPDDREVTVGLDLPDDARVHADPRLFLRAVENLLRNAVQHARGEVLLELTQDAEHVRVAIHDDGPGIPVDLRQKVTVPFFRPDPDRARKTGGVGLGLAIVDRVVRLHAGSLEISRSPLGGAVVATVWPRPA